MTKEEFKAFVSMAYDGREKWEQFLERVWQLHVENCPSWVSVEDYATDELPPLINEKDPYGESVHVLFVVELDGIQFISKGCFDYDSGMWHALETDCSYCKENVTNWMPLPEPPAKLSSVERNEKKWKE